MTGYIIVAGAIMAMFVMGYDLGASRGYDEGFDQGLQEGESYHKW